MRFARVLAVLLATLLPVLVAGPAMANDSVIGYFSIRGTVYDQEGLFVGAGVPVTVSVRVNTCHGRFSLQTDAQKNVQSVEAVTNEIGSYDVDLELYGGGAPKCDYVVEAEAVLPDGFAQKGSLYTDRNLKPDGMATLDLGYAAADTGSEAQLDAATDSATTTAPDATSASDITYSGDALSPSDRDVWALRIGLVLGMAGLLALFIWLDVLVARAARRKGRSFWAWFWIAFFFLIPAAIIVAIMGPTNGQVAQPSPTLPAPTSPPEPVKRCPYCGEEILAVATKCKHCGEFLND